MQCAVATTIDASAASVWAALTGAAAFPSWNSTVSSIDGTIALGEKLKIKVPVAPHQAFDAKVIVFEPSTRLVWQGGFFPMFQGTRTWTLSETNGRTEFSMVEVFRGAMVPMIKGSLPDLGPVFEQYAAERKSACEA
jgi:uncharacterized protein YndB with AHSA1/START domain